MRRASARDRAPTNPSRAAGEPAAPSPDAAPPAIPRIPPASFLLALVASTAGAGIAALALTDANPLLQTPFHHDDFELLAASVRALPPLIRPVSDFTIAVLADLGAGTFYAVLLGFILLCPPLATLFTARFLEIELATTELAAASFAVGLCTFLFEASSEAYRWIGFITNAMSASLGTAAALLALRGAEPDLAPRLGALALFALAVFAKEDCGPFVLVAAAAPVVRAARLGQQREALRAGVLLAALAATGLAAIGYGRLVVDSPFTGGVGIYQVDFTPAAMARIALRYATITPGAIVILLAFALATAAVVALAPAVAARFLGTWLLVGALALPYLPLPQHVYAVYAYDWLPIMLAATTLGLVAAARGVRGRAARAALAALGIALAAALAIASGPGRNLAAADITARQANNRAIARELQRHRDTLAGRSQVIVEGLDGLQTPWWFSNAAWVNRRVGADVRWLFVAAPDSMVGRAYRDFDRPLDNGAVAIVTPQCADRLRGIARLRFGSDLRAEIVAADDSGVTPTSESIAAGDDGAFCQGWSSPESGGDGELRWAQGSLARIALPLPRGRNFVLVLRAKAAPGLGADPLWSAISIDGRRARVAKVPREPGDIAVDVPASLVRGPTSLVTLEFGDWRGRGTAGAPDARADAAGIERVVVR